MIPSDAVKPLLRAAVLAFVSILLACGAPVSKPDAGKGGGSGGSTGGSSGGGTGGGSTGGGTGGGSTGGGSGGGATGGSATGGGTGGSSGTDCTPQTIVVALDAGCGNALPSPGACGGDVTGAWCVTEYCLNPTPLLGQLSQLCNKAYAKTMTGTVRGSAKFVGTQAQGTVLRDSHLSLDVLIDTPPTCLLGGFLTCDDMASLIQAAGADAGCSSSGDGGCLCGVVYGFDDTTVGTYQTGGGFLDAGAGRYEYCVQPPTLTYRKVQPANSEPGIATMSK